MFGMDLNGWKFVNMPALLIVFLLFCPLAARLRRQRSNGSKTEKAFRHPVTYYNSRCLHFRSLAVFRRHHPHCRLAPVANANAIPVSSPPLSCPSSSSLLSPLLTSTLVI